jgi:CBS domain-containing protein
MSTNVKKQTDDQNIMGACKIMHDYKIGCVVIVELEDPDSKPVGIITERDIVRILGELKPWLFRTPLRELMSKPIITIQSKASLREAIDMMNSHDVRRLIVVDNDSKMTGIITEKDIFKEIAKNRAVIADFLGTDYPAEHREVYERFADCMLDLLPRL